MASAARPPHEHERPAKQRSKLVEIAHKARGRTPLKYELELIPFFAGAERRQLPAPGGARRGRSARGAAEACAAGCRGRLRTATLYRDDGGRLLPKEYSLKIQHVRGGERGGSAGGGHEARRTVGKIKLDVAPFCAAAAEAGGTGVPQEVFLQLKPAGKLKLSVKAVWLRDARVDLDALTEASFNTHRSSGGDGFDEQARPAGMREGSWHAADLSGFDHQEPGVALDPGPGHAQHGQQQHGSPRHGGGAGPAAAGTGSKLASAGFGERSGSAAPGSPRIAAGGPRRAAPGTAVVGAVPPFSAGLSPQEERAAAEQEKARQAAFSAAEVDRMRRTLEEQLRAELHDALAKHHGSSWRDWLCCCCGPRAPAAHARANQELAAQREEEGMLI
ncbi:hypothetical protein HT031_001940 [Scenedesmus sp. PABB004]|nr:hypothetical protein HT031_001940 [Scenedesmus sp. PABB004]